MFEVSDFGTPKTSSGLPFDALLFCVTNVGQTVAVETRLLLACWLMVVACYGVGEVSACRMGRLEPYLVIKHIMFYDWTRGRNMVFYQPVTSRLCRPHRSL